MRLGIDLGTTRTIVAAADRGNYPVVGFETELGDISEHFPTVSADLDGALVHGHQAVVAALDGHPHLSSWKRLLARHGPDHRVQIGSWDMSLLELTTDFLGELRAAILERSNAPRSTDEKVEAVVSVPANAHSSQRFTTLEAYRRAGFDVLAMLNEPSAAGIEYAHRYARTINTKREHVAVYDLGGGTFDAALVLVAGAHHEVVATAGVQELGGDDFDRLLLDMALEQHGSQAADLPEAAVATSLFECRAAKESINPNTRKLAIELTALAGEPVVISVAEFYARLAPLVDRTLSALEDVMGSQADDLKASAADAGVAGIYVVGGASALPYVARSLREHLGHRVHRSVHPAGSTAIGLAIAADSERDDVVQEQFTRHLGVFREAESGARVTFDPIFERGTPMPQNGRPLVVSRRYRAAHNVGCFRFIECAELGGDREPAGDMSPHATIVFPFSPDARGLAVNEEKPPIERLPHGGHEIEERYEVNAGGIVEVTISDLDDGYSERYRL